MPSEPVRADQTLFVGSDEDIDAVIDLCDGDEREAIRSLIMLAKDLQHTIDALQARISHGYVRGRYEVGHA